MKLSDYVTHFLKKEMAVDSVFLLSGGGIMHLVDSFGKSNLAVYCCHHEQAAVIAAEGYGRLKNSPGVAVVTTGPGGTNAITGIAGAWLDSVPLLVIAGQVKRDNITPRQNGVPVVRQIGFQELNVIDVVKPITKYAVTVENPEDIKYHLQKAVWLAKSGRPGPVFVEIPLDVQAAEVAPENLRGFEPEKKAEWDRNSVALVVQKLAEAKRPLLMAGNGVRLAGGEEILWKLLDKLKINAVTPIFTADDLITYDYPYYLGRQGIPGNETANYAIDNCDLLLVIGERLQLTQTSYDYEKFAASAYKIMVDIDAGELTKKTLKIDLPIRADAKDFLEELLKCDIKLNRWDVPVKPIIPEQYPAAEGYLNVYAFFEALNKLTPYYNPHYNSDGCFRITGVKGGGALFGCYAISTANGMASVTTHQALRVKRGQRLITNAGLGHMGSGLPLAIGACVAAGKKPVICMEGDGSIMLNIHELQTVFHHQLPIKIFIFNNNGYYSIRSTHLNYFQKIFAADSSSGVSLPDYSKLIPAWNLPYERINNNAELSKIKEVLERQGPVVCELMLDPAQPMPEKWKAGGLKEN